MGMVGVTAVPSYIALKVAGRDLYWSPLCASEDLTRTRHIQVKSTKDNTCGFTFEKIKQFSCFMGCLRFALVSDMLNPFMFCCYPDSMFPYSYTIVCFRCWVYEIKFVLSRCLLVYHFPLSRDLKCKECD